MSSCCPVSPGRPAQLDAALLVNPHDPDDMADALDAALRMDPEERQERWQALWRAIEHASPLGWGRSFLAALLRTVLVADEPATRPRLRAERSAEGIGMVRRTPPLPASPTSRQIN